MPHALQTMCCRAHWGACRRGRRPARGRQPRRSRSSLFCWVRGFVAMTCAKGDVLTDSMACAPGDAHGALSLPMCIIRRNAD